MEVLRPDTRIGPQGRFVIRSLVGSGGMGQVYRAVDTIMKREVAIKTVHKDLVAAEPLYAERFLNEAIAAGGIAHQHVVKVHDYGVHDGQPYIVMEYLQGQSLSTVLLAGPLPIERAADIVLSACSAVYFCHRHKIYHRDLKPSNVFLVDTEDGDFDHVVVLDFGVAKIAALPDLTKAGSLMGTPSFLAPESITSKNADPLSDQYSLGVLLYYALTRKLPFRAPSDYELWQAIRSGVYKSPRQLRADIPPGLEEVVRQAMNLDPGARFPNVHMMGRALLPFASPAGRRHWSTLFTAAPRPIKDPSPSMAMIAIPVDQQATAVDLTRTRDAQGHRGGPSALTVVRETTIDTVPNRAAATVGSSISIGMSGEIESAGAAGTAATRLQRDLPPEPSRPPDTPAALAASHLTIGQRALNPRFLAVAGALIGVVIVAIAIAVAIRASPWVVLVKPPALSVSAEPVQTAPVVAAPALSGSPPSAHADVPRGPAPGESAVSVARRSGVPARAERSSNEGKRRHRSPRVRRDENGVPIIE
jgi:serine/threonine protein kinase